MNKTLHYYGHSPSHSLYYGKPANEYLPESEPLGTGVNTTGIRRETRVRRELSLMQPHVFTYCAWLVKNKIRKFLIIFLVAYLYSIGPSTVQYNPARYKRHTIFYILQLTHSDTFVYPIICNVSLFAPFVTLRIGFDVSIVNTLLSTTASFHRRRRLPALSVINCLVH